MTIEKVSIILPVFNEQESLAEMHGRIASTMAGEGVPFEVIFVDDGSTDDSLAVMKNLQEEHDEVVILSHARNHGKSLALMQGLDVAEGDVVITMDADLQEDPEDIPLLLEQIRDGYDMAVGYRRRRKDSFCKRFVSKVYNYLVTRIVGATFKDINCGFKAFTRKLADRFELRGDMHRLMPAIAVSYGFTFTEVQVAHHARKYGESKYVLLRHRGLLDLAAFSALSTTQLRPFHVLSEIGFLLLLAAAAVLMMGYIFFHTSYDLGGLSSFFGYCSIVIGAWLSLLGVLCPITGLLIEALSIQSQGKEWRKLMLRNDTQY